MSFGAPHAAGSKPLTSPAMRVGNDDASKWVIGPMMDRPLMMPSQLERRSMPTGERMPSPVTTTRRLDMTHSRLAALAGRDAAVAGSEMHRAAKAAPACHDQRG